jgi:hypothetical protein
MFHDLRERNERRQRQNQQLNQRLSAQQRERRLRSTLR